MTATNGNTNEPATWSSRGRRREACAYGEYADATGLLQSDEADPVTEAAQARLLLCVTGCYGLCMGAGGTPDQNARGALAVIAAAFACDDQLAATIAAAAHEAPLARGAVLWPLPDRDETTLILAGSAQEVAYGHDGAMLQLSVLGGGDFYGALMGSGDSDAAQTESLSDGRGAHFATPALVRLMDSYGAVARAINRQLAARLEALRRRMVEATLLSVTGRVCAELMRRSAGTEDRTIRPMPIMSELAISVRSTRETVSRTISQLEKRGMVQRAEGGLTIVAPHRLEELIY